MKISKRIRQNDKVFLQALSIKTTSPGGFERRTAKLCLHSGIVIFVLGDKS